MGYLTLLRAGDVVDAPTFAAYCQQEMGTPLPSGRELIRLRVELKKFFESTPRASWSALAKTVDWCKTKRRRCFHCWGAIANVRYAWADGAVPELDPAPVVDTNFEDRMYEAIHTETDQDWRRRLIGACGEKNRKEVLAEWTRLRQPSLR